MSAVLARPIAAPRHATANPLARPELVIRAFLSMRETCPHYCGRSLEWDTRECAHRGNDHGGSRCCLSGCPAVLHEADAKGVR